MKKQKIFWLWSLLATVGLIVLIGATSSAPPSQGAWAYPAAEIDAAPAAKPNAQTGQLPVVLVHGLCGTNDWGLLEQTLNQQGITTAAVDFRGVDGTYTNGDIKIYAQYLDTFIQDVFGPTTQVDIVAHSMGGLISRYYITSDDYAGNVRKLITLGTPNGGSEWARLVILSHGDPANLSLAVPIVDQFAETELSCFTEYHRPAFRQLVPGSNFLDALNALPMPELVEVQTLIGRDNRYGRLNVGDSFVSLDSARLGDYPLYQTGDTHLTYSDNPETIDIVLNLLQSTRAPQTVSPWPSFEWWPVLSAESEQYIPDVTDKAQFLQNNVTSDFGFRSYSSGTKYHFGIDMRTLDDTGTPARGLPVIAVADGVVEQVQRIGCNANVGIYHPEWDIYTQYYHLLTIDVQEGQNVVATQQIGTSGPPESCTDYGIHLDFRVRYTLVQESTGRAAAYLNPLIFYDRVNLDMPLVSDITYRDDTMSEYAFFDITKVKEVGSQDLWIGFQVSTRDRDIDEVSIWLDDDLQPLYRFSYYAGESSKNDTMPIVSSNNVATYNDSRGYVATGSLKAGQPSRDWFYYHLYSPTDVAMQRLLEDGRPHTIYIRAYDVFGNMDEVSFQIELVQ